MKKIAPLFVLISSLCWASTGIVTRYARKCQFTTIQNSAFRITCAAIFLVVFLAITDKTKLKVKKIDFKWFVACGVFSLLLNNLSYSATVQFASLSVAVVLLYTSPIFVMILSAFFLKEKITFKKICAMIFAFVGCLLTVGLSNGVPQDNLFLVLCTGCAAGLGFGLYSILGKFLVGKYAPLTIPTYMFLVAAVILVPLANPLDMLHKIINHTDMLIFLVLGSVLSQALPYVCYSIALKYMESSTASIIVSFEVVVASLYGVLLYDETLNVYNIVGIFCIICSILILEIKTQKKSVKH